MNGFRITVLTLLCLSVGLMFCTVFYVVPGWQEAHGVYQASLRIDEYEKKNDIHRQQMVNYAPDFESPEVTRARMDVEAAAKRDEQTLTEAEELKIVAAAKRREEEARARAQAEAAREEEVSSAVVGLVASYDPMWQCIMIKPAVPEAFIPGGVMAVRRDGYVLCEAVVDSRDSESGQVSATVKLPEMQGSAELSERLVPIPGDEVIPSPFPSGDELRAAAGRTPSADLPPAVPAGEEPQAAADSAAPSLPETGSQDSLPALPEEDTPSAPLPPINLPTGGSAAPYSNPASGKALPSLDAMLQPTLY